MRNEGIVLSKRCATKYPADEMMLRGVTHFVVAYDDPLTPLELDTLASFT